MKNKYKIILLFFNSLEMDFVLFFIGFLCFISLFIFIAYFIPLWILNKLFKTDFSNYVIFKYSLYFISPIITIFFIYYPFKRLKEANIVKGFGKFTLIILSVFILLTGTRFITSNTIRSFVIPFQISGNSMFPNYYDKQFVLIDTFSLREGLFGGDNSPQRGDVIVTTVPNKNGYNIKRIIGLPGETITLGERNFNILNSQGNNEYSYYGNPPYENINKSFILPENGYFVLGDNLDGSFDSKNCFKENCEDGDIFYITKENIQGKVFLDLGYYDIKASNFTHPVNGQSTYPTFLNTK